MRVRQLLLAAGMVLCAAIPATAQDQPRVVAVNYPLQYFAERLLGDEAQVDFPVPMGVDPSFWRPSISDISDIQSADLILLSGAGFATWVDRVSLPRSKVANTAVAIEDEFIVTESITHSHGDGGEHSHEGTASYIWLDPKLAAAQAAAVASAIMERGLAPAGDVEDRLASLTEELDALDAEAAAMLDGMADVAMIATHPRYQYLARRYGLSVASLEWEAGEMPGEAELAELDALVAETGAEVLIWEANPPEGAFEAMEALGLRNVVFAPLAQPVAGLSFVQSYAGAVAALAGDQ